MVLDSPVRKRRLRGKAIAVLVGLPLLCFALGPFPGLGMMYPITDTLRGHPQKPHGTRPTDFVGLWVRDETVMYDFVGQAFYLMPDGSFAGMSGMTSRRWHFDNSTLFVDAVSRCGNCYRGNVTTEYATKFVDADHLLITNRDATAKRGVAGNYRRVEITNALKSQLNHLKDSENEGESFKAHCVLSAIEQSELR